MNRFDEDTGIKRGVEMFEYAEHIGVKTHIVSTHKCKPGVYGCAKLIGCQIWDSKQREEANDE